MRDALRMPYAWPGSLGVDIFRVLAQSLRAGKTGSRALREYREGLARLERELEDAWSLPQAEANARFESLRDERMRLRKTLDRAVFSDGVRPTVACDALPSPQPGELSLYVVELGEEVVGFAKSTEALRVQSLGPRPDSDAPEVLSR